MSQIVFIFGVYWCQVSRSCNLHLDIVGVESLGNQLGDKGGCVPRSWCPCVHKAAGTSLNWEHGLYSAAARDPETLLGL